MGADVGALSRERHGAASGETRQVRYLSNAMTKHSSLMPRAAMAFAASVCMLSGVAEAHHSFAMYDLNKTYVMTGVVIRVDPNPNHLQIFFAPLNEKRDQVLRDNKNQPVVWTLEM